MSNGETVSRRPKGRAWIVVVLIIALVAAGVVGYLYFRSQQKVLNLLQLNALQSQRIDEFGKLSDQVREFNARFGARFGKIHNLESIEVVIKDIEAIQAQQLPSSIDTLIAEFKTTAEKVDYLGDQIEKLENSLGKPHMVAKNESHSQIIFNYLMTEAGLSRKDAEQIMKRTALIWELEPGNHVYNIYWNGVFLTTVTQGTAKRSPLIVQKQIRDMTAKYIEELETRLQQLTPPESTGTGAPAGR
jgi:type II secretory pathway pseudopilin PulG